MNIKGVLKRNIFKNDQKKAFTQKHSASCTYISQYERVYNAFLELYIQRNDLVKMQMVLSTMMTRIPPNSITMTTVVDMLGRLGRIEEMETVFREMQNSTEAQPTVVTYHQVMAAYSKRGDVNQMEATRKKMHQAGYADNAVSYNILLVGYTRARQYEKVPEVIAERARKGVPMDDVSYSVLVRTYGFCQVEGPLDEVVAQIANTTNIRLLIAITAAYGACHNKIKVTMFGQKVLDHPQRLTRDVCDVLSVFARYGEEPQIELILQKHNKDHHPQIFNQALRGFARLRNYERAQSLLEEMHKKDIPLDSATGMELSAALMKTGKIDLARTVLVTQSGSRHSNSPTKRT